MDNKKEIYRSLIGVFTIILVVAGATYAWFTWKSSNTNINGTLGCFDIDYVKGQDIGSAQSPEALRSLCSYEDGVSTTVTISTKDNCYETATGSINLTTTAFNLYDGSNAFTNAPTQNVLKYQVTTGTGEDETPVTGCNGYVDSLSTKSICDININRTPTTYTVYLYLDCNTVTTTYIGSTYSGYIQTTAAQEVE